MPGSRTPTVVRLLCVTAIIHGGLRVVVCVTALIDRWHPEGYCWDRQTTTDRHSNVTLCYKPHRDNDNSVWIISHRHDHMQDKRVSGWMYFRFDCETTSSGITIPTAIQAL